MSFYFLINNPSTSTARPLPRGSFQYKHNAGPASSSLGIHTSLVPDYLFFLSFFPHRVSFSSFLGYVFSMPYRIESSLLFLFILSISLVFDCLFSLSFNYLFLTSLLTRCIYVGRSFGTSLFYSKIIIWIHEL